MTIRLLPPPERRAEGRSQGKYSPTRTFEKLGAEPNGRSGSCTSPPICDARIFFFAPLCDTKVHDSCGQLCQGTIPASATPMKANGAVDMPLLPLAPEKNIGSFPMHSTEVAGTHHNRDATVISFTSQSEFFKGKTETFPVMRFFLELTQHIAPKGCQYIRRYAPVCFPHQGKMAGHTACEAAGSRGVEEGATADFSRGAALRCRGSRFGF